MIYFNVTVQWKGGYPVSTLTVKAGCPASAEGRVLELYGRSIAAIEAKPL